MGLAQTAMIGRALIAKPLFKLAANKAVNFLDLLVGRRPARTDGPNGLVRHNQRFRCNALRQRLLQLTPDHSQSHVLVALRFRFANTYNDAAAAFQDRLSFGLDYRIHFTVIRAPLRMPDDDPFGAGIGQHLGTEIAGMGARFVRVAILTAQFDAGAFGLTTEIAKQRGRRTNNHLTG